MAKYSEGPRTRPSDAETREGYRLWFGHDFRKMIENAIDHYNWDDTTAQLKAHEAAKIVLDSYTLSDPPTIHIRIHNSIVYINLIWPESQERH